MSIGEKMASLVELIERGRLGAGVGEVKLRPDILAKFVHDAAHTDIPKELRAKTRQLAYILAHPSKNRPKYSFGLEVCAEIFRVVREGLGSITISEDLKTWATWVGTAQELLETQEKLERTIQ